MVMKVKELREQDIHKLKAELANKLNEYAEKKALFGVKREKDTSMYRKLRLEIARINTLIREKEVLA